MHSPVIGRIAATATDDYTGPDAWALAPEDFDAPRMSEYTIQKGLVVLVPSTRITKLAIRNRFMHAEKVGIDPASIDNPSGTLPQRQQQAALRFYLADVASASWIDLARADTRAGVQQLRPGRARGWPCPGNPGHARFASRKAL